MSIIALVGAFVGSAVFFALYAGCARIENRIIRALAQIVGLILSLFAMGLFMALLSADATASAQAGKYYFIILIIIVLLDQIKRRKTNKP